MTADHSNHVLELATFKLNPGVTKDQFAAAIESISVWAHRQPGFVSRNLSYHEAEDTYIDVVYWESLEAAQAADTLSLSSEECAPLFAMCEPESITFIHAGPVTSAVAV